jgi:7tm Odorant receptor
MEKLCDEKTEEEKFQNLQSSDNKSKKITSMEEAKKKAEQIKIHKARHTELEKCIAIHGKIKMFVKKIGKLFAPVIFVQGAMSMVMLCTAVFGLSKVSFKSFYHNATIFNC